MRLQPLQLNICHLGPMQMLIHSCEWILINKWICFHNMQTRQTDRGASEGVYPTFVFFVFFLVIFCVAFFEGSCCPLGLTRIGKVRHFIKIPLIQLVFLSECSSYLPSSTHFGNQFSRWRESCVVGFCQWQSSCSPGAHQRWNPCRPYFTSCLKLYSSGVGCHKMFWVSSH